MTVDLPDALVSAARGEAGRIVDGPVSWFAISALDPELRLHSVTGGVYQVQVDDRTFVLKVTRRGVDPDPEALWVSGTEPAHRNYWKREWLAFASGLLDSLPGTLRAPRRMLTTEHDDGECWIWMEQATGRHGPALTLEDYAVVGSALGETQGAFASGRAPLPTDEWLSRKWLRGWAGANAAQLAAVEAGDTWDDDRLAPMAPFRDRALAVWHARDELLGVVESAPQTVVHLDFWPMNVFVDDGDGEPDVVAIDWSQIGIGAVGQDLDQITLDPIWMVVTPDLEPQQLEWRVVPSYLQGLRNGGLDVDESDLQRWYAAAAAVKYVPLLELQVVTASDPVKVEAQERRWRRSFGEVTAIKSAVVRRAVELGEWALESQR